ncbi:MULTISPECIES: polynucleotide adenylyltransferase PcnB [unclassified Duganella]|uniref:polynucleotide adenylyltransferase PcnB n=1 Tax=unclassified Duganella TaxID=2636909 RepID=UPI000E34DB61|nr:MULTISPECIES: polynucleotide adenylyltransferase PcnB [unclassified Duganella]RFP11388.1 polynucleotide adenylyltransferase PcnB [Duganella sp. BJB475]RFP29708.1 polynucleotide adenylyltransferase PcnB [Duganella sp. BJB476]
MIKKLIRKILGTKSKARDTSTPVILGPEAHGIDPRLLSSNAVRVTSTLQEAGYEAFVVGGAVRDLLLGVKPKDFDIATNATPEQVKRLFRRAFIIGKRFQIVHVMFGQDLLEVTTFRGTTLDNAPKDEHGRVLRDNTFGSQAEDAVRRDFTINAMYYNPANQQVLDYHGGVEDIRAKTLRIIGQPEARYREDPVRMLRVVRFAAKLKFTIEPNTGAPIPVMASLIDNVPAARVFDEMLKLLMSGQALACLQQLRKEGLHHGLLPLLDVVLEQPLGFKFVTLALDSTDARIHAGKTVSPGFLFASLLWHQVLEKWTAYRAAGEQTIPALHLAADDVLDSQTEKLALQRKIGSDMRDIWSMQPRFERRSGKSPHKLLEHLRFRAGYDFLLLRCASGEIDAELGEWWTAFYEGDDATREDLIATANQPAGAGGAKRKRAPRRGGRSKGGAEGGNAGGAGGSGDGGQGSGD